MYKFGYWLIVSLALVGGLTLFLIGQVDQICGVAVAGVILFMGGFWLIIHSP